MAPVLRDQNASEVAGHSDRLGQSVTVVGLRATSKSRAVFREGYYSVQPQRRRYLPTSSHDLTPVPFVIIHRVFPFPNYMYTVFLALPLTHLAHEVPSPARFVNGHPLGYSLRRNNPD